MPHVALKLLAGRSAADKQRLADALSRAVRDAIGSPDDSISVSVEDIDAVDWPALYRREIAGRPELLFKAPGYVL